ncbi:MAG TPA: cell division protein ZapA [Novosphingobium sp.]|nr:cell division protein ZapA [Novosphingobium sp.]
MSNVTLSIGGRSYTVACAAGEEDHVRSLGDMIDARVRQMEGLATQGEARMLLFAALLLADDLHEARSRPDDAALLDAVADRLENLASRLETGQPSA